VAKVVPVTGAIRSGGRKIALTAVGFALAAIPAFAVDQSLPGIELFRPASESDLDRVAFAVDGAESSHGTDLRMWRPELNGPQGPMQVSAAAATDLGGGNRFDMVENRQLGRGYLALMYRRYGNWPDAITAYNWGPGNMDAWIASGRPIAGLPFEVERYRDGVLRDAGFDDVTLLAFATLIQCYATRTGDGCGPMSVHATMAECRSLASDYQKFDRRALRVTRLPVVVSYDCVAVE
jgi:hypothetical protein